MNPLSSLGKILIVMGVAITAAGILLILGPKIPWLGKLPGDFLIRRENLRIYFPITTCIVISLVLTLLLYLFRK